MDHSNERPADRRSSIIDIRKYTVEGCLKNGLRVTVRAIRAEDDRALLFAFRGLDEKTLYLRFFGPKREITEKELKEATDIDFIHHVALVTCLQDDTGERIIGAGRYITFGDTDPHQKAEIAFTVGKAYQGLGIAGITLRHLAGIAQHKGIRELHADILRNNKAMLAVFKRSGFPLKQEFSEGVTHITLSIADNEPRTAITAGPVGQGFDQT